MSKNGWKEIAFQDMADLVKDSYHPTGSDDFKYIGLEHIDQQSLSLNSFGHSSEVESNKFHFMSGDILFGKLRPYFRKVYRPHFDGVCSTDIWVVRAKDRIDQGYLFYRMASHEFVDMASSGSSGTRMPRADWNHLKETIWPVPSLSKQKQIAKILGDLDEKIELNRQTNQTLEAIAQAIYKEWFVDFRFPHSPLEGCPKGGVDKVWQAKPDGVDSLQTTPSSPASWLKNSLFPFWTLPKNRTLQERSKELRKQGLLSEVIFWKTFKEKKKLGWDIDRQVIIGNFIVDFFIPELGLIFEIDGSSHNDKQEYDQKRDAFLSSLQLKVVRIPGKDVLGNIEGVWRFVTRLIKERVEELSPPRPSGTPQEGKCPPRQASPATPQEGKKCEMQDSELGPIPKGWRVGKLGEVLDTIESGSRPKGGVGILDNGIPSIGAENIIGLGLYDYSKEKFISSEFFSNMERGIIQSGDVLIYKDGASLGRKSLFMDDFPHKECAVNEHVFILRANEAINQIFLYFWLDQDFMTENIRNLNTNSAQPGINKLGISSLPILIPDKRLMIEYEKIIKPMLSKLFNNCKQSTALAAIRDALLPKLMSGEIEV